MVRLFIFTLIQSIIASTAIFAQTPKLYDATALDSLYENLKSSPKPNVDLGIFDTITYSIAKIDNDTIAGDLYHRFANLRLDMGHWDSVSLQIHEKGFERIKASGDNCKLAISQFNLTRYALFQDHPETLDLAKKSLRISEKCGDLKQIAHAQSFIGAAYINLTEYKNALNFLLESEKNYTSIKDSMGIAMVNLDLAMVYSNMQDQLRSVASTKKAADIYKNKGKDINYAVALIDMCSSYLDLKETDSVIKYLPMAHEIVIDKHQLANAYVYQHYGHLNIQQGRYDEAIDHLKTSLDINKSIDDSSLNVNLYNFLVDAYKMKGSNDTAYNYALKSDSVAKSIGDNDSKLGSLLTLAKSSYDVNKFQQSHEAFLAYIQLKDSVLGQEKIKEIAALEKFYESEKRENLIKIQQQENELLNSKNKAANNRNIALIISLFLLGAIGYALINKFRLRATKQEAISKLKDLENENLNQKIAYHKRELASKALHIAQKNEMLMETRDHLKALKKDNHSDKVNELINKLHIDKQINDNWDQFTNQFIEMNPDFYKRTTEKYPNITKNDIRMIALLKMKYDSNAIASLLNISLEGVKKARYRLRKKLQLSSDDNLEKHIMEI
ncbi:tetratricopeptide repeat protein [Psychroserpens sp. BH13MA-6]